MAQELKVIKDNEILELTHLPLGRNLVSWKWVYNIRYNDIGVKEKYKARLITKGFSKVKGENFNGTFSHVAKMTIFRCLLTIVVEKGWELHKWMLVTHFYNMSQVKKCIFLQ